MHCGLLSGVCIALAFFGVQRAAAVGGQSQTATIEGRVTLEGSPPPPTVVTQDGGFQQALYVDRSGGLRYAVVFLPDARAGGATPVAAARMNQRNFIFEPQVLAVRSGQTVRFTSEDPANHNVRADDSNPSNTFNINTAPGSAEPDTQRFAATRPDRPLQLSCDIHPWMTAWIYVFDHAQFAVTTADGSFRIDNVPVGRHRIAVRQPSGGLARDVTIEVRPGATARLDVRFASSEVRMHAR
jgi:plastocyanin